jgi:hypothetical protein
VSAFFPLESSSVETILPDQPEGAELTEDVVPLTAAKARSEEPAVPAVSEK